MRTSSIAPVVIEHSRSSTVVLLRWKVIVREKNACRALETSSSIFMHCCEHTRMHSIPCRLWISLHAMKVMNIDEKVEDHRFLVHSHRSKSVRYSFGDNGMVESRTGKMQRVSSVSIFKIVRT